MQIFITFFSSRKSLIFKRLSRSTILSSQYSAPNTPGAPSLRGTKRGGEVLNYTKIKDFVDSIPSTRPAARGRRLRPPGSRGGRGRRRGDFAAAAGF